MFDRKRKASKYKGVYKCGRKWKSQIQLDGVQHYLGVFDTEEIAASVYAEMSQKLISGKVSSSENSSFSSIVGADKSTLSLLQVQTSTGLTSSESMIFEDDSSSDNDTQLFHEFQIHQQASDLIQMKVQLGNVIRRITELNQILVTAVSGNNGQPSAIEHVSHIEQELTFLMQQQNYLVNSILAFGTA